MGAADFFVTVEGTDADDAFQAAVASAQWEHGHGGYTGTIAEKRTYLMATTKTMSIEEASDFSEEQLEEAFGDKWGPAGCVETTERAADARMKVFAFFGVASC